MSDVVLNLAPPRPAPTFQRVLDRWKNTSILITSRGTIDPRIALDIEQEVYALTGITIEVDREHVLRGDRTIRYKIVKHND